MILMLSMVLAFGVSWLLGRLLIPALRALKAGQSIKEIGPNWHMSKQGTPTMGGLMFIGGVALAVLLAGWKQMMAGDYTHLIVFAFAFVFGIIGYIDDFQKVRRHKNTGLSAIQKFLLQLAASVAFVVVLRNLGLLSPNLYIPFIGTELILSWPGYMAFAAFVMVATVNAVNLTDGVDGLATGVTLPVALFYVAVAVWFGQTELGIFPAALTGGLAAFLLYNYHPAKVFMGDTGSLFLGGAVCGMAFVLDMPLVIPIIGLIYVAEVLSDVIQVTYYKMSHGKRVFRMAPLHHHLELGGWSEVKLFWVFSTITATMCFAAFLGVIDRVAV